MKNQKQEPVSVRASVAFSERLMIEVPAEAVEGLRKLCDHFGIPLEQIGAMIADNLKRGSYGISDGFWETCHTFPTREAAQSAVDLAFTKGDGTTRELYFLDESGDLTEGVFSADLKAAPV